MLNPQANHVEEGIANVSGNSSIDTLLRGYKWGGTTITYSFYAGGGYYGTESNVQPVSEAVKQNVREIIKQTIEPLINVTFVEVADAATSYGQIRYLGSTTPTYAYATPPLYTDTNQGDFRDSAGDVCLNIDRDHNFDTNGFQGGPGTHGYYTLIHETLHALGLKHPGNYNGTGEGIGPFLPFAQDNLDNSIMTYNFQGAKPGTPMPYDILALQYLYGAKSFNSTNTIYNFEAVDLYSDGVRTLGSSTQDLRLTIWDSGGIDILNFNSMVANPSGYHLDLNQGGWICTQTAFNSGRYQAKTDLSGTNYLTTTSGTRIGYGVEIEHAIGTSSNDTFYGNSLDNEFYGQQGNDNIYGGVGNDLALYSGTSDQYQIINGDIAGEFIITDSIANRDGVDRLNSIERIQFSDKIILLDSTVNNNNDNFVDSQLTSNYGIDLLTDTDLNEAIVFTDNTAKNDDEIELLTGGDERNLLSFGDLDDADYFAAGDPDYATITNFEPVKDSIYIANPQDYSCASEGKNTIDLCADNDVNDRDLIAEIPISGGISTIYNNSNSISSSQLLIDSFAQDNADLQHQLHKYF